MSRVSSQRMAVAQLKGSPVRCRHRPHSAGSATLDHAILSCELSVGPRPELSWRNANHLLRDEFWQSTGFLLGFFLDWQRLTDSPSHDL